LPIKHKKEYIFLCFKKQVKNDTHRRNCPRACPESAKERSRVLSAPAKFCLPRPAAAPLLNSYSRTDSIKKANKIQAIPGLVPDARNYMNIGFSALPEYRGQGLGKRQIEAILRRFRDLGVRGARVSTCGHAFFIPAQCRFSLIHTPLLSNVRLMKFRHSLIVSRTASGVRCA
jgi:GNAT superfamily N-acetyltransferase